MRNHNDKMKVMKVESLLLKMWRIDNVMKQIGLCLSIYLFILYIYIYKIIYIYIINI